MASDLHRRSFSLRCLIFGHHDSIARAADRLFLRCGECGRETHGWSLALYRPQPVATPAPTWTPLAALQRLRRHLTHLILELQRLPQAQVAAARRERHVRP